MGTRIREISLFSPNFFSFLFSIRKLKKMKLEISLIFAMSIFAAVEGAPHNSPDKEYDARISSTYYQALKTKLADIEAGVRIVDEQGGSSQPAAGRLEVYQDGKDRTQKRRARCSHFFAELQSARNRNRGHRIGSSFHRRIGHEWRIVEKARWVKRIQR